MSQSKLPVWGSKFCNIDVASLIKGEWATNNFVIEPFTFKLTLYQNPWLRWRDGRTRTIIGLKNDIHLNGKKVNIQEINYKNKDEEEIDTIRVKLLRNEENLLPCIDVKIWKQTSKKQFWIKPDNLGLSVMEQRGRSLEMSFDIHIRLKRQTHIGLCFFPRIEFEGCNWCWTPNEFWCSNDYREENGKVETEGNGIEWADLYNVPKDAQEIFRESHRIKVEVYMHQLLQYPENIYTESGKAWPYIRKCQEELAISVERDQKKIQKNLQSLIYSNEEMMSDLNTMNEKTKKENQDLKKQIAELKEWKQQQQRDLEEEKKEDDDPEFDVKKWLKKINLEKYGDLLIESGFDDLESILDVNIDDLKEIGIVLGHRKKII
eukprot:482705_1